MIPKIRIREIKKLNLENGYLIDGFPSVGFTSAIATESMIHTSKFELGGVIDSEAFPPISVVKDGKPNFPTRIFVNEELKVGIFLSYLTLDQSLHRITAKTMLSWAKKQKIKCDYGKEHCFCKAISAAAIIVLVWVSPALWSKIIITVLAGLIFFGAGGCWCKKK